MKPLINQAIEDFYNNSSEEDRLTMGLGPLEFERNKLLIGRFLPPGKATVIDVGGGTGKYSEWMAEMGHKVSMVDPVRKHITQANRRSDRLQKSFEVILGEARKLDFPDDYADLVILHGPLYHLQEREERISAIKEASRITKPGGVILGFAINYTASTFVGLLQGVIHDKRIFDMCLTELTTGIHNPPSGMPGLLAEAFYHRPEQLKEEFAETRLTNLEMFAVEGLIWLDSNFFTTRANRSKYEDLLELCRLTEKDPNLVAVSPHMMIAGRK